MTFDGIYKIKTFNFSLILYVWFSRKCKESKNKEEKVKNRVKIYKLFLFIILNLCYLF